MGEWTYNKPTEPGWYWTRGTPHDQALPTRIVRRENGKILFALIRGNEPPQNWTHKLDQIGGQWWSDPVIPPPEAPGNEG